MQECAKNSSLYNFLAHLLCEIVLYAVMYPRPGRMVPRSYNAFSGSLESCIIGVPLYRNHATYKEKDFIEHKQIPGARYSFSG